MKTTQRAASVIIGMLLIFTGFVLIKAERASAQDNSSCFIITQTGQRLNMSRICEKKPPQKEIQAENQGQIIGGMFKGITLALAGHWQQAEQEFRRVITIDPNYSDAYDALGNVLAETGRMKEAIASYRKAIDLRPSGGAINASAYNNLGIALVSTGDTKAGIRALCQAFTLDPNFPNPRNNLLLVLPRVGERNIQERGLSKVCQRY